MKKPKTRSPLILLMITLISQLLMILKSATTTKEAISAAEDIMLTVAEEAVIEVMVITNVKIALMMMTGMLLPVMNQLDQEVTSAIMDPEEVLMVQTKVKKALPEVVMKVAADILMVNVGTDEVQEACEYAVTESGEVAAATVNSEAHDEATANGEVVAATVNIEAHDEATANGEVAVVTVNGEADEAMVNGEADEGTVNGEVLVVADS